MCEFTQYSVSRRRCLTGGWIPREPARHCPDSGAGSCCSDAAGYRNSGLRRLIRSADAARFRHGPRSTPCWGREPAILVSIPSVSLAAPRRGGGIFSRRHRRVRRKGSRRGGMAVSSRHRVRPAISRPRKRLLLFSWRGVDRPAVGPESQAECEVYFLGPPSS